MTILIKGITAGIDEGPAAAVVRAAEGLRLPDGCVLSARLAKSSVDARRGQMRFVCTVAVTLSERGAALLAERGDASHDVDRREELSPVFGDEPPAGRPVVVGFGPGGMFAALLLAQHGYRPLVLERGASMGRRSVAVERFWKGGELEPDANVQFGEGGAGAFSDGKLTTRINDPLCGRVLRELVRFGAPEEILLKARPHVGTDLLRGVVKRLRGEIERLGGEVRFRTAVRGFDAPGGRLRALLTDGERLAASAAVAAVGHSARDTFEALERGGALLLPKAFSVGVRIEHRQGDIERALYGRWAGHPNLPRGEYQLSHREGERAAYTFCMCPGGMVVAAASAGGQVVTNGMSYHDRALPNANAALAVSVSPDDYGPGWRDGVAFQRRLEEAAFAAGGGDFTAPCMTVGRLLGTRGSAPAVDPSYPRGVKEADLAALFPPQVSDLLRRSLPILGRKLAGFDAPGALLTGVETRTSSPVRMPRGDRLCSMGIDGLYPCGEGAGQAGGIMSAAVDGLRCALALMARFSPPSDGDL